MDRVELLWRFAVTDVQTSMVWEPRTALAARRRMRTVSVAETDPPAVTVSENPIRIPAMMMTA